MIERFDLQNNGQYVAAFEHGLMLFLLDVQKLKFLTFYRYVAVSESNPDFKWEKAIVRFSGPSKGYTSGLFITARPHGLNWVEFTPNVKLLLSKRAVKELLALLGKRVVIDKKQLTMTLKEV